MSFDNAIMYLPCFSVPKVDVAGLVVLLVLEELAAEFVLVFLDLKVVLSGEAQALRLLLNLLRTQIFVACFVFLTPLQYLSLAATLSFGVSGIRAVIPPTTLAIGTCEHII